MRVAFHDPLGAPGDAGAGTVSHRARLSMAVLVYIGYDVHLATTFRSLDPEGDHMRQLRLAELGWKLAHRLLARWRKHPDEGPDLWLTGHLSPQAPDWIGPAVSEALAIPYVVAGASFSPGHAGGAWDPGYRAVELAVGRAAAVFCLDPEDRPDLERIMRSPGALHDLPDIGDATSSSPVPVAAAMRLDAVLRGLAAQGDR